MSAQRGFTLVELMIVVVILAIIVAIAVPSYRNFVLRSHRTDATAALLKVRTHQERFFLQNNRYAAAAQLSTAPPAGLGFPLDTGGNPTTEHGYFRLAMTVPDPGNPGPSFLVTAQASGGQLDDDDCRTLSINDRGVRGATNAGGTTNPAIIDNCWK